jgi:Putative adhesin
MTSTGEPTAPSTREVPLAPGGDVELLTTASEVRVRGHDEDVVRVRVLDDAEIDDVLRVEGGPDHVRIHDLDGPAFRLGPLTLRPRHAPDLELEVPRRARLTVRTVSGDVVAEGLAGETRWATTSGELRLALDGGPVRVESTSGDVDLRASAEISLGIRSVSGDLRIRAPRLLGLAAESTSGEVHVEAALARAGAHTISTVSGDVELATDSPLRLETQTVTGDVEASVPHRTEGSRGRRTIVVGDGATAVRVRTMSGDVGLHGGPRDDDRAPMAGEVPEPPLPPVPPLSPAPPFVVAQATAAPNLVRQPGGPSPATGGGAGSTDRREAARLEVLRALERGELDVEDAAHRLQTIDEAGPLSFRGWV